MGKKKRVLLILFFIILVHLVSKQVFRYVALQNSDVIVRVAYRGLENLFHVPYEYYAVGSKNSCRIPNAIIKKHFGEEIEKREIYDDEDNNYWYVQLKYSKDDNYYFSNDEPYLLTSFGDQYRLFYKDWARKNQLPEDVELNIMIQVAEKLFDGNPTNWTSQQGDTFGVLDFMLIRHSEKYLIKNNVDDGLYRILENGDIVKVMNLPEKAQYDYYYFYERN